MTLDLNARSSIIFVIYDSPTIVKLQNLTTSFPKIMAYHMSFATLRTADLAKVRFERKYYNSVGQVNVTFSTFVANQKCSNAPLFIQKNNNINNEQKPTTNHSIKKYDKKDNNIIMFLKNIGLVFGNSNAIKALDIKYIAIDNNYGQNRSYKKSICYSEKNVDVDIKQNYNNKYQQQTHYYYETRQTRRLNLARQTSTTNVETTKNFNSYENQKKIANKYWFMRYMLFSKFDCGIQLDEESFYSVCPEILSYHIAKRCDKHTVALDPFCGAGGNVIQLALTCKSVIAMDIDPYKIKLARHNANIYGVAHKIKFVVGNFFAMTTKLRNFKPDVIVTSPPWGGPQYLADDVYSLKSLCDNTSGGGFKIFKIAKTIAPNIALHIPRTTNVYDCISLGADIGKVEIQQNIINGKLNSITAFYGEFNDS